MKNIKTKKKHGAGKAIAAVALSAIMLVGGGAVGYGAGTNWTYKRDTQSSSNYDDYQGGTILTPDEQNGIELAAKEIERKEFGKYGIAKTAENAYTLRATIEPASADDKRVEWTVTCADAGVNVSEYITLSSDGLTAVLTCLKDFDKQFTVTVKSLDNPNATASCRLDYVERITGVTVTMPQMSSETVEASFEIVSSKYTIQAEHNIKLSKYQYNAAFDTAFGEDGGCVINYAKLFGASSIVSYSNSKIIFKHIFDTLTDNDFESNDLGSKGFYRDFDGLIGCFYMFEEGTYPYDEDGEVIAFFRQVAAQHYIGTVDFEITATYNGKTYSSDKKTVEIWIDGAALHVPVTGITLPPNLVM